MRGGALPPALLAAALGLALAFARPRDRWIGVSFFAAIAIAASQGPWSRAWLDGVFLAGWAGVVAGAASVHLPPPIRRVVVLPLAMNAGVWAGGMIALAGAPVDLIKALPWVLLALPAARLAETRAAIALKVVASWLIAVAALAALLPFLPVTPGYLPDHLD
ncbi:MAG: hypothetical protein JWP73_2823 [Phenylobacterium sp.]|nr:hypothetical protein [Phenylobacterium sp.]